MIALCLAGAAASLPPVQSMPVAVLAHPVARGALLQPDDFTSGEAPESVARSAMTPRDAAGMEARRNLVAANIVRPSDVGPRQLVRRGEPVTIRLIAGVLTISTSGRALASGAMGDPVRVVASATSRTLDGTVDGAGSVRISAP